MTRESKVVTTAPTWRQVKSVLWQRIHSLISPHKELLGAEVLSTQIRIHPDWEAIGLATSDPSKFQGFHSPGGVLLVVDEAGGVDNDEIWAAMDGCLTGERDRMLCIGNPTVPEGQFFVRSVRGIEPDGSGAGGRQVIRISAFDVPNVKTGKEVVPGLVSKDFVERKRVEWGEDSPMWQSRILGQFPTTGSDALYPLAWLERAFQPKDVPSGERVAALDVARKGADSNALCVREGGKLLKLSVWSAPDTQTSVGRFVSELVTHKPQVARIDTVGLGGPMFDQVNSMRNSDRRLRGIQLEEFEAGSRAFDEEQFQNLKAEAYFHFRGLLERDEVDLSALPLDLRTSIEVQATAINYEYMQNGKLKIEDKQQMKRRKGFSPDELEAIIMAYYDTGELPVDEEAVRDWGWKSLDRTLKEREKKRSGKDGRIPPDPDEDEDMEDVKDFIGHDNRFEVEGFVDRLEPDRFPLV